MFAEHAMGGIVGLLGNAFFAADYIISLDDVNTTIPGVDLPLLHGVRLTDKLSSLSHHNRWMDSRQLEAALHSVRIRVCCDGIHVRSNGWPSQAVRHYPWA